MDDPDDPTAAALAWLLASDEPAVRYLARRDLLGERDGGALAADAARRLEGPKARALLAGQRPDGGFGVRPYSKWTGAHWRLVSLVELAAPAGEPRLQAAASTVLDWLTGAEHRRTVTVVDGLARRCASQEGNALAVACRLGLAGDPRAELLARSLAGWQWPDGGWNCDRQASGRRSSFHESLPPAWGLHEFWLATGATWAQEAAARPPSCSCPTGCSAAAGRRGGRPAMAALRYPPYWHYDVLQALLVLSRLGLDLAVRRRRADGRWWPGGYWWRPPGGRPGSGPVEVVDWGRSAPSEMLTLNALRVLRAAGVTRGGRRARPGSAPPGSTG